MEPVRIEERRVNTPAFADRKPGPTKTCYRCGKTKILSADYWYRDRSRDDGFYPYCKTCHKRPGAKTATNGFAGTRKTASQLGSHGVTIRAGEGVTIRADGVRRFPTVDAVEASTVELAPAAPAVPVVAQVTPEKTVMGATKLADFLDLEETPSVWLGPAGVSVMASRDAAGALEYLILTPYGDAPGFATDREAVQYIAGLLIDRHAPRQGAALDGVLLLRGSRR